MNNAVKSAIAAIDKKYYAILENIKARQNALAIEYKKGGTKLELFHITEAFNHLQYDARLQTKWASEIREAIIKNTKFSFKEMEFECFNAHDIRCDGIIRGYSTEEFDESTYVDFDTRYTVKVVCATFNGNFITPKGVYFSYEVLSGTPYNIPCARVRGYNVASLAGYFFSKEREDACFDLS